MPERYSAAALRSFAAGLLAAAGLEPEKAEVTAAILVEGDLLGHTTHGLHLLAPYLDEAVAGRMAARGSPEVLADAPAAVCWDGRRLPGPWLTVKAVDLAIERARAAGTATVVVRRSHHIACLAAYGLRAAERGMMLLMACSDPAMAGVAPHGGLTAVFSPDPIAAAWPAPGGPVLIDVSQSITAMGAVKRAHQEGRRLPGAWVIGADGVPTDDPGVMFAQPPGALLPTGGRDHGHKGYAFALLVEALTGGLAGHGRADPPEGWSSNTFVQVFDPARYAGAEAFRRQADHLARACRAAEPVPGGGPVRLPGERGLRLRERQLAGGVELHPAIMPALRPWAARFGLSGPEPL